MTTWGNSFLVALWILVLTTTSVASKSGGEDIEQAKRVLNSEIPSKPAVYSHIQQIYGALKTLEQEGAKADNLPVIESSLRKFLARINRGIWKRDGVDEMRLSNVLSEMANTIDKLGSKKGYELLSDYLHEADLSEKFHRSIFDGLAGRLHNRPEMKDAFLYVLENIPKEGNSDLSRACQMFRGTLDDLVESPEGKDRNKTMRIIRALLSAATRATPKSEDATYCDGVLRAWLMHRPFQKAFLDQDLSGLRADENSHLKSLLAQLEPPSPPRENSVVNDMVQAIRDVSWNEPFQKWREKNRQFSCEPYGEKNSNYEIVAPWCYACVNTTSDVEIAVFFFDEVNSPSDCYLESAYLTYKTTSETALDNLRKALAGLWGPGRQPKNLYEFGSAYWRNIQEWEVQDRRIFLYQDIQESRWGKDLPAVRIMARSLSVEGREEKKDKFNEDFSAEDARKYHADWEQAKIEAANAMPELQFCFSASEHTGSWMDCLRRLPPNILRTQELVDTPVLLYLADGLIQRVVLSSVESDSRSEIRQDLEALGVKFSEDGMAQRMQLLRLAESHLANPWGLKAFTAASESGWDYTPYANTGDQYVPVIARGEAFLREHPTLSIRKDILFDIACAYETWWCLTLRRSRSEYRDDATTDVTPKFSDTIRQRAIRWYEMLVKEFPDSMESGYARPRLIRLKLGIDTGQTKYIRSEDGC